MRKHDFISGDTYDYARAAADEARALQLYQQSVRDCYPLFLAAFAADTPMPVEPYTLDDNLAFQFTATNDFPGRNKLEQGLAKAQRHHLALRTQEAIKQKHFKAVEYLLGPFSSNFIHYYEKTSQERHKQWTEHRLAYFYYKKILQVIYLFVQAQQLNSDTAFSKPQKEELLRQINDIQEHREKMMSEHAKDTALGVALMQTTGQSSALTRKNAATVPQRRRLAESKEHSAAPAASAALTSMQPPLDVTQLTVTQLQEWLAPIKDFLCAEKYLTTPAVLVYCCTDKMEMHLKQIKSQQETQQAELKRILGLIDGLERRFLIVTTYQLKLQWAAANTDGEMTEESKASPEPDENQGDPFYWPMKQLIKTLPGKTIDERMQALRQRMPSDLQNEHKVLAHLKKKLSAQQYELLLSIVKIIPLFDEQNKPFDSIAGYFCTRLHVFLSKLPSQASVASAQFVLQTLQTLPEPAVAAAAAHPAAATAFSVNAIHAGLARVVACKIGEQSLDLALLDQGDESGEKNYAQQSLLVDALAEYSRIKMSCPKGNEPQLKEVLDLVDDLMVRGDLPFKHQAEDAIEAVLEAAKVDPKDKDYDEKFNAELDAEHKKLHIDWKILTLILQHMPTLGAFSRAITKELCVIAKTTLCLADIANRFDLWKLTVMCEDYIMPMSNAMNWEWLL